MQLPKALILLPSLKKNGSLSSSTTSEQFQRHDNVSLPVEPNGNLRHPAIGVSPFFSPEMVTNDCFRSIRLGHIAEAKAQFSNSAVALLGENLPWEGVGRGTYKFRSVEQVTYFIGNFEHGIKIGISNSPIERLFILQTGSPVPLRILACAQGGREREREYHNTFAEHRKHGEWFHPAPEILAEIDRLNAAKGESA